MQRVGRDTMSGQIVLIGRERHDGERATTAGAATGARSDADRAHLDAAAQVFSEVGYEAATTNAIAARAQTPIGSLYHFFPNKEAILYALATQYLEGLQAAMETAAEANAAELPLSAHVERTIDIVAAMMMARPAFRAIVVAAQHSPEIAAAARASNHTIAGRIEAYLAERAPHLDGERRTLTATICLEIATTLLVLARGAEEARRARIVAETKRVLIAYLAPFVAE